jgi:hypothetical protein
VRPKLNTNSIDLLHSRVVEQCFRLHGLSNGDLAHSRTQRSCAHLR